MSTSNLTNQPVSASKVETNIFHHSQILKPKKTKFSTMAEQIKSDDSMKSKGIKRSPMKETDYQWNTGLEKKDSSYYTAMACQVGAAGVNGSQPIVDEVPILVPPVAPDKQKSTSLKSFVSSGLDFDTSDWTYDKIMESIDIEGWRVRDIEEVIKDGDLVRYIVDPAIGQFKVERAIGLRDIVVNPEQCDVDSCIIYTLEGGGKKKVPPHNKTTADYASLFDVPSNIQLKLPTDEREAERFFGCDVVSVELLEKGRIVKGFYPVLPSLRDKKFRATFSQVFSEFARKHFRDNIKGLIPGRGEGIRLKRGASLRYILKHVARNDQCCARDIYKAIEKEYSEEKDAKRRALLKSKLNVYGNIGDDTIRALMIRNDYRPKNSQSDEPPISFIKRMEARNLTPTDFKYEKAIGVEIEALCPIHRDQIKKFIPSYVRVTNDNSIKDDEGHDTHGPEGNGKGQFGAEFRILIKRAEMETRIFKALDAINNLAGKGVTVNKTCGLHVHFDMRDKKENEVLVLHDKLVKWLSVLIELIPANRRTNKYCQIEHPDNPHWEGVSMQSYSKHKTLEIRVHSSSTDHIKILRWINLLETLMGMTFLPIPKTSTLDALKMLPLSEAERTYWIKRHQHLNKAMYKEKDVDKLDLGFLSRPHEKE